MINNSATAVHYIYNSMFKYTARFIQTIYIYPKYLWGVQIVYLLNVRNRCQWFWWLSATTAETSQLCFWNIILVWKLVFGITYLCYIILFFLLLLLLLLFCGGGGEGRGVGAVDGLLFVWLWEWHFIDENCDSFLFSFQTSILDARKAGLVIIYNFCFKLSSEKKNVYSCKSHFSLY